MFPSTLLRLLQQELSNKKTDRTSNNDCLYPLNIFYSFLMFSVGREKVHWERMV